MHSKPETSGTNDSLHLYLMSLLNVSRTGGRRRFLAAYAIAVSVTVLTFIIYLVTNPPSQGEILLTPFIFPIILSAFIGGIGPGLAATVLSAALMEYFIILPHPTLAFGEKLHLVKLLLLVSNGLVVSVLAEVLHRSRAYAEERTRDYLRTNERLEEEIAEHKRTQEILQEREDRLRSIFLAAPVGIGLVSDRRLVEVNTTLCSMTGYGRDEMIGQSARMLYLSDEEYEHVGKEKYRQIAEGETGSVETRWQRKDGAVIDIVLNSTPLDRHHLSKGVTFTALDVTDQVRVKHELLNSLKEKEILLREVHHRVKNNLQVISSLITLQSDHIHDGNSLELLEECQNRIKAMALVHQELYRTKDFSSLDFSIYVTDLAQSLYESYAEDRERVSLDIEADTIYLDIDQALPCGMIINELVSNSLKHAFPDGRRGSIGVRVRHAQQQRVIVSVSDDGVGLPEGLDPCGTETLGLQLVCLFAEQLRGSIEVTRNHGTTFQVSFQRNRDSA